MSNHTYGALLIFAAMFAPGVVYGQVVISEIAWMGTDVPTNAHYCEWVELHNQGAENVSLSGWRLSTADGGMNVALSGSIDAGTYFVIERYTASACPDPVPGISDQSVSFGSGLSNAGEVLVLTGDGQEHDRIVAGGGWEDAVGGDSEQKLTAQRNGTEWVTAAPTPGAINATESVADPVATSSSSSSATKKVAGNPIPSLLIEAGGDRIVSTKAHTFYHPIVYDSTGRHVKHPYVTWAFGDGERRIGTEAEHAYREPGEYLVVVRAEERYSRGTTSFVVIADPADVRIALLSEKGVSLENRDTRILDLSRYQLTSGKESFRIPADTQILPGRTVIFPPEVTGLSTTTTAMQLRYPSGELAFSYPEIAPAEKPTAASTSSSVLRAVEIQVPKEATEHVPTIEVPARTAESVGAGTLSPFKALFAPIFRFAAL
ncbi:MAG TPA: lamin tail domain-containing protein [Candidatus Paceibacterota bacterium]|nr:lamin tail domain-containing protein [Candidatus Paceibacterota bacterium]